MKKVSNWQSIKLKYLADLRSGETITSELIDKEEEYPVYGGGALRGYTNHYTHDGEYILIGRQGANCGSVRKVTGKFYATEHAIVVTYNKNVDYQWLYYLLDSMNLNQYSIAAAQPGLSVSTIRNLIVELPPIDDQIKIKSYINNKLTVFTETLVLKEKLIALLEEKRQSIITESVTKGLNPNTKMKDSGLGWIGEIPEHWEKSKLGYLGKLQNGVSKSGDEFGYGSPFVSYGDVYKNMILPSQVNGLVNTTKEEQKLYSVEQGDIFFTRTSETIEEIGFASVCLETIPKATYAGFLIKFRPNLKRISPNFAKYYFRSDLRKHYFIKEMNLVTRASLGQGLLRNFPVMLPSLAEQEEIAYFLDCKVSRISNTISLIQTQIQKLKEYRQSLIYEAVTGKIDIRDLVTEK